MRWQSGDIKNRLFVTHYCSKGPSQVVPVVKKLPTNAGDIETQVWSLGREDPLEKGMATHSSILAWKIPWTEESGGLQSVGSRRVGYDWVRTEHWALSEKKIKETFIVWRNEWKKKYLVTFYFLFPFRLWNHRLRKRSKTVWKNRG